MVARTECRHAFDPSSLIRGVCGPPSNKALKLTNGALVGPPRRSQLSAGVSPTHEHGSGTDVKLREIRIEASSAVSDHGVVPPDLVFRWTAHHVRELVAGCLPKAYILDGSSVFQITCGPRGSAAQYSVLLGSSEYFAEDFDFAKYRAASPTERDETLLTLIDDSLSDVAARVGADSSGIKAAVQQVRGLGVRRTVEVKKLGRKLAGGERIRVVRTLSREEGETWRFRLTSRSEALLAEVAMGTVPNFLDRREYYARAEMVRGAYVVRTRLGKEAFRYDLTSQRG
jgi:hypothetical protein